MKFCVEFGANGAGLRIDVFPEMPRKFVALPELVLVRFMHRLCAVYRAAVFCLFGLAPMGIPGR